MFIKHSIVYCVEYNTDVCTQHRKYFARFLNAKYLYLDENKSHQR